MKTTANSSTATNEVKDNATTPAPILTTALKDMKVGNIIRCVGSKKRWMVAEINLTAKVPYVHLWSEKANYRLKDVNEEFIILEDNKGKLPAKSKDDWAKQMASQIQEHLDIKTQMEAEKAQKIADREKAKAEKLAKAEAAKKVAEKTTPANKSKKLAKVEATAKKASKAQVKA